MADFSTRNTPAPVTASSAVIRTCIGCRTRKPDNTMVRVAIADDELIIDQRGIGRGAWLCRNESCVESAARTRAFSRAFRSKLADRVLADTLLGWLGKPTH